uniref:Uncharacterized protein n=1 Tax=Sphaerodactylus townsendi TaxID=933632 RepID=A0ACB8FTQ2_9SAUR
MGRTRTELHRAREKAWMVQLQQAPPDGRQQQPPALVPAGGGQGVAGGGKPVNGVPGQAVNGAGQPKNGAGQPKNLQVANRYNRHPQESRDSRFVRSSLLRCMRPKLMPAKHRVPKELGHRRNQHPARSCWESENAHRRRLGLCLYCGGSGRCLHSEAAGEDPHFLKKQHFDQGPQSKEEHSSAFSAHRAGLQFFR